MNTRIIKLINKLNKMCYECGKEDTCLERCVNWLYIDSQIKEIGGDK